MLLTRGFDLSIGMTVSLVSVVAALAMTAGGHRARGGPVRHRGGAGHWCRGGRDQWRAGVAGRRQSLRRHVGDVQTPPRAAFHRQRWLSCAGPAAGFLSLFGGTFAGVPVPVAAAVLVVLVVHLILGRTVFGRSLYLIVSSPAAARVAGVRTRLHLGPSVSCSGLGAFGALLLTARTQSGEPDLGGSLALQTIAAAYRRHAVAGRGGKRALSRRRRASSAHVLSNGMDLVRVDSYIQQVCVGAIILASLVLDRWTAARRS